MPMIAWQPMVCYVAIWEDRHCDTSVRVFSDSDKAVEWAKATVRKCDRWGELDETMTSSMQAAGWIYRGRYSYDGDCIRVVKAVMDDPDR